jgi:hypothetical protein
MISKNEFNWNFDLDKKEECLEVYDIIMNEIARNIEKTT